MAAPDIEARVEEYNQRVYGGTMSASQKQVLRDMLEREDAYWEREARDYVYGFDEGEPPKGARW